MKKILAIVSLFLLVAVCQAQNRPSDATLWAASTTTIPALSTNLCTNVIADCRADITPVQITFKMTAACTSNMVFNLVRSVDGSQYGTAVWTNLTVAGAGTAAVSSVFNLDTPTLRNFKLYSIENQHATAIITNLVIKYGVTR
jgi:hypothetical protein